MLSKAKWRLWIRQSTELRSLASSSSGNSNSNSGGNSAKTAAVTAGICGMVAMCYGLKRRKDEEPISLLKQAMGQKFNLHAASKVKKNRSKNVKQAAAVVSAAASEAVAAISAVTPSPRSLREKRFLEFASVEYQGQAFMTPTDFLDAVVQDSPSEERVERRILTEVDAERMLRTRGKPTKEYFRSLGDGGLISYTEYIFLLCILTKPHTSFRVAFNMLDADGNQNIDKKEFLVMERIFASTKFSKKLLQGSRFLKNGDTKNSLQKEPERNQLSEDEKRCDTTLMRRFFGRNGRHALTYEDFYKFMESLQTEILEIEFQEFSHGQDTIKETDFARLLLRYAFAHRDEYTAYMKHIDEKIRDSVGITFEQYQQFCLFLTDLDDFAMAVKLYTYRDLPVTQSEFARAAKVSTGFALDSHIVNTVFQIFDINEDGRLSYGEFISVMRDRLHRGAKRTGQRNEWQTFKKCVREELRRY